MQPRMLTFVNIGSTDYPKNNPGLKPDKTWGFSTASDLSNPVIQNQITRRPMLTNANILQGIPSSLPISQSYTA